MRDLSRVVVYAQANKFLKPNTYCRDFQLCFASEGFGEYITFCQPGIGLTQALAAELLSLFVSVHHNFNASRSQIIK